MAYFLTFCHSDILLPPSTFKGPYDYPGASQVALVVKNLLASAGDAKDVGLIPGSGRSPGGGHGNPLQCSCLGSHQQRSQVGYSPWGHKETDMTEAT